MKKYAIIEDAKTKRCSVGIGTDTEYYESIGMTEQDVEKSWDGDWYIVGYAPEKPQSIIDEERIAELQNYLDATDWYAVRFAETGVAVPDAVKAERQAAREEISRLRENGGDNG